MAQQREGSCRDQGSIARAEGLRREDETLEPLLRGSGLILQKRRGYRFSIDALLLAHLVTRRQKGSRPGRGLYCADLGTGCGIVPVLLAKWDPQLRGCGVEIQEALASVAERNLRLHGLEDRFRIVCSDLKELPSRFPRGCFDLVTINPPYREPDKGHLNPDPQKAMARHELTASLADICAVMGYLLRQKGKAFLIYPAGRLAGLLSELKASGLEPGYARPVHHGPGEAALCVLVEAVRRGKGPLLLDEPLYIKDRDGRYTAEVEGIFLWQF